MNTQSDQELLKAYAKQQDEAAFAQLVEKYAGMVYNTANRHSGNAEAAHDITQTAFAVLATKAEKLIKHTSIGAWLHRTTVLESKKHLRTEQRHSRKMKALTEHAKTNTPEQAWEEVGPVLDEAIEKLSSKDREIVVLRFIEDLNFSQITDRLGATEAACRKRLERALDKLHGLISSQGTAISATTLASGLAAQFSKAAPPTLMQGLCQSALTTAAQTTTTNLLTTTLTAMTLSKTVTIAGIAVLAMIPIGLQWMEIQDLKSQVQKQSQAASAVDPTSILPAPSAPITEPAPAAAAPIIATATPSDDIESFRDKMLRVMDDGSNQATEEERLEFWQSVRSSKELDGLISELSSTIENDPEDIQNRLVLAQAYIAKVWGSAGGTPEQGLWASKAEGMWKEVLEVEPTNWSAQRNIAFSYSQYPDFANKTPEAIQEYEKTVDLQEVAPEPGFGFSRTYLNLSKLYLKNGDPSNALATLEKGVAAHPESDSLAEQLKVITSSYKFE